MPFLLALALAGALAEPAPASPPDREVKGTTQPRPLMRLDLDYPATSLRAGEQGDVGVTLEVGVTGRVTRCAITASSGFPALDAETCRMLTVRSRYAPATDVSGAPVAAIVSGTIHWRLPAEPVDG